MKFRIFLLIIIVSFSVLCSGQNAYYDAIKLCNVDFRNIRSRIDSIAIDSNLSASNTDAECRTACLKWQRLEASRIILRRMAEYHGGQASSPTYTLLWDSPDTAIFNLDVMENIEATDYLLKVKSAISEIERLKRNTEEEITKLNPKFKSDSTADISISPEILALIRQRNNRIFYLDSLHASLTGKKILTVDSVVDGMAKLVTAIQNQKKVSGRAYMSFNVDEAEVKRVVINTNNIYEAKTDFYKDEGAVGFGIPSQSQIIWATTDFVADRLKLEINSAFMKRFKSEIKNIHPLDTLFPETLKMLEFDKLMNYQSIGVAFKTAIEKDLKMLPEGLAYLLQHDPAFARMDIDPNFKTAFVLTVRMIQQIKQGYSFENSLNNLQDNYAPRTLNGNPKNRFNEFEKAVHLMHILSDNFKHTREESKRGLYVTPKEFRNAVEACPSFLPNFLFLVYNRNRDFFNNDLGISGSDIHNHLPGYQYDLINLLSQLYITTEAINGIKEKTEKGHVFTGVDYAHYVATINGIVEATGNVYGLQKNPGFQLAIKTSKLVITCYEAAEARDYGGLINSASTLLRDIHHYSRQPAVRFIDNTLVGKHARNANLLSYEDIAEKILKNSLFVADVLGAKSQKQLKNVISSYALPAGSSSVKRGSQFTIALNAYAGGFGGCEWLSKSSSGNLDAKGTIAFTVPIGIDISHGIRFGKGSRKGESAGSLGLFVSLFDLGSLVSFRLRDSETKNLPEVNFKNILTPGAYLCYGIPKCPLTVYAGIQRAPALRKAAATGLSINNDEVGFRLGGGIAVDIPMFNFYNKPFRKKL